MANVVENISYDILVDGSDKFKELRRQCIVAPRLSLTGIVNLIVNYEDPCLVDCFLKKCYVNTELYKEAYDIDAVELQKGQAGKGHAAIYLDTLIFGSLEEGDSGQGVGVKAPIVDPQTGKRQRRADGFVNRKEIFLPNCKDRLLIIKNLDYCLDFCGEKPGVVDPRFLWIFDNFRNPSIKMGCKILLITNEPIKFPFKVRSIKLDPVDAHDANHIINSFVKVYNHAKYSFSINNTQKNQIIRKLKGLTYSEASDFLAEALSNNGETALDSKIIDPIKVVKNLREKVNRSLMEEASGLTHLNAKPWNDYICPKTSNFTFDVKKIVRDFDEINTLREQEKQLLSQKKDNAMVSKCIEAIRARMPHVIILYGRGGVGKSAFPIHFAGLLDLDVWDFNIGASHSKWVGEGAQRMRDSLAKIGKASHLVIRIDEYDRAIGSTENSGQEMHAAYKQVESEFMNWLQNCQEDNFFKKNDIFLVLTTNHKENITGPLLRTGRADLVIDINNFDDQSMKETFLSSPRRSKNRGIVPPVGFNDFDEFEAAIKLLDIDKLVPLCSQNGFTVRDVDTLLIEMASHNYYFKNGKYGLPWTTEMFIKVLEGSTGSAKNENTSELVLGDRFIMDKVENKEDSQIEFPFAKDYSNRFDIDSFKKVDFFR